ncbi:ThiF family adenylyltransferase [Aliarcobacter cryaerophilus]|uniref:ThiF family adenylyltransferase n=1 Tax=Aliarcobacter cryaerophilus TaxID=28198 RepID=A0AA46N7L3_9BACT|nr:ThiF family adenylyltransferase [Aliarcobacter cryaerophilus]UYF44476.1 ThiF family adenylyltransferase [Aliarcobacter cryaerophilus]
MHKNQQLTKVQILAEEYLKEIGFLNIPSENKVLTMTKEYMVNTKPTCIIIKILETFPLEYPKFYIKDSSLFLVYPHIEQKNEKIDANAICLFEEKDKFYYENIEFLLFDNIKKLEQFINDINNGKLDSKEIFDEFDSYWDYSRLVLNYNKKFIKSHESDFKLFDLYISKSTQNLMIIDNPNDAERFFNASRIAYDKKKILYINFKNSFPSKIPANYKEFLDVIKDTLYFDEFKKLKSDKNLFNGILFSFILPNGDEHFSFLFMKIAKHTMGKKIKILNPIVDFLMPIRLNRKLEGGVAKDISMKRIFSRGGSEMNVSVNQKDKKIAIIGCGSIGASLAYKLLKVGCTNLVLIDLDRLSVDNISRHLLGMEYVNINKALALENFLKKQFIGVNINAIPNNAVNCYEELKSCDLIISAVGSDATTVEIKMIKDAIIGELPSVISCWVEANAIAGHGILFEKDSIDLKSDITDILDEIFEQLIILEDKYGKSLKKDDVGCNSSYMPYSFLNSEMHVNHFANIIVQYILDLKIKPIISSIGNIAEVKEHLKENYKNLESFTLCTKELF